MLKIAERRRVTMGRERLTTAREKFNHFKLDENIGRDSCD
jgi:hypothetical protein